MIRRKTSRLQWTTVEDAYILLDECDKDYQRKLNSTHVERLALLMHRGEFRTGCIVRAQIANAEWFLVNGQHQLHALISRDMPGARKRPRIWSLYEEYECDDLDDYRHLFHSYDTENRQRSFAESAKAYCIGQDIKCGAGRLNQFRAGLDLYHRVESGINSNENEPGTLRTDRFDRIQQFSDELDFFCYLASVAVSEPIIVRAPISGAMIDTLVANRGDDSVARQFWNEVATTEWSRSHKRHPALLLHHFLREHGVISASTRRFSGSTARPVGWVELWAACIRCWNAMVDGRELHHIRASVKGALPRARRFDGNKKRAA